MLWLIGPFSLSPFESIEFVVFCYFSQSRKNNNNAMKLLLRIFDLKDL